MTFTERFLSSTRGRIVGLLRRGEATVEELASELRVTDNAVRAQLTALERDGLVRQEGSRRGSAKPSYLYRIAPDVEPLLSRLYVPMFVELVRELDGRLGAVELSAVMRAAGQRIADTLPAPQGTLRTRVAAASRLLNSLGGVTEVEPTGSGFTIRGYSCPLGAAAAGHREVCEAVEVLLGALVGTPVQERCNRENGARCCFEVSMPAV